MSKIATAMKRSILMRNRVCLHLADHFSQFSTGYEYPTVPLTKFQLGQLEFMRRYQIELYEGYNNER